MENAMTKSRKTEIQDSVTNRAQIDNRNVTILDTTLRDGSYAIDFKFSLDDTRRLASELQNAGVKQRSVTAGD